MNPWHSSRPFGSFVREGVDIKTRSLQYPGVRHPRKPQVPQFAIASTLRLYFLCFFWACILTAFPVRAAPDDCLDAREVYRTGVGLLRFEDRRGAFQRAVILCPSFADAHVNLADAYENLGEFERAEDHYLKAIGLNKDSVVPYVGLGEVYLKTGRFSLSRDTFQAGIRLAPQQPRLLAGLKAVSERLKRESSVSSAAQIKACLVDEREFRLMCMCPTDYSEYLRRWICVPPLFFAVGSSWLSPGVEQQLHEIGTALTAPELAGRRWDVIGHADNQGTRRANLELSEQRAHRVRTFLVEQHGMDAEALTLKYFGDARYRAENSSPEGRAQNRRVEIVPVQ
jgi:tetratricopeptide (TPR) repeat protein